MTRSQAAELLHVGPETLRYYENILLVETPRRDRNNYRNYTEAEIALFRFIISAKKLGFTLAEIRELAGTLRSAGGRAGPLQDALSRKIEATEHELELLTSRRKALQELRDTDLSSCDTLLPFRR